MNVERQSNLLKIGKNWKNKILSKNVAEVALRPKNGRLSAQQLRETSLLL